MTTPSGYYVFWPDEAHPAVEYVHVPGGSPPAGRSGFYFVDVHEIEANKLEEFWGRHLQDGADLIPVRDLRSPGVSETQRVHQDFQAMADSQRTAEVVAERALGKPVKIDRLGALVYSVSKGFPAAQAGVRPGDVITAVDGHPVRTEGDVMTPHEGPLAGRRRRLHVPRRRHEAPAHRLEHRREAPRHHRSRRSATPSGSAASPSTSATRSTASAGRRPAWRSRSRSTTA